MFEIGKPHNHSLIEAEYRLKPKTQIITPRVGSVHGQVVKFVSPGVTVGDESGLRIIKRGDPTAVNHCEKLTVPEQGVVLCELKKG